jgi:2-haloalkanoic acid dehalogenase type II
MNTITTVIFDMYETLAQNRQGHWLATFENIVQQQQLPTDPGRLRQTWLEKGRSHRERRLLSGAEFQSYSQSWISCFAGAFEEMGVNGDPEAACRTAVQDHSKRPPYPETVEALASIRQLRRTALLSNADDNFLRPNLELFGIDFEQVLSSEEARCYKPQPGLFLQMLGRIGVTPGECLYVGDRQLEDVKGAGSVGMGTVWVNRIGEPLDPDLPSPDYQVSSLLELAELLE